MKQRSALFAAAAAVAFSAYSLWPLDMLLVAGSTAAALAWFWLAQDALRPGAR